MEVSSDLEKGVPFYGKKKEWNELKAEKRCAQGEKCVENIYENLSNRE